MLSKIFLIILITYILYKIISLVSGYESEKTLEIVESTMRKYRRKLEQQDARIKDLEMELAQIKNEKWKSRKER